MRVRVRDVFVLAVVCCSAVAAAPVARADTRIPTRFVVLTDHSTPVKTWSDLPLRVRLETADGTPLPGKSIRVWDDAYTRWICCGPPAAQRTDANGELFNILNLDGNSANPVHVAVYWHGDDVYGSAIVDWWQPLVGYTTDVRVTHAAERTSGQTLPVTLSVHRTDPAAQNQGCIDGTVVNLALTGPTTQTATTTVEWNPFDGTCTASVEFGLSITPGAYTLTASTGHEGWWRCDEPDQYSAPVNVKWQRTFNDSYGRGTVRLNPVTQEYRVSLADGRDSGVRNGSVSQTGVTGTVSVYRIDLSDPSATEPATGTFYSTGSFSASGRLAGSDWRLGA